jgi:hypothetical protein
MRPFYGEMGPPSGVPSSLKIRSPAPRRGLRLESRPKQQRRCHVSAAVLWRCGKREPRPSPTKGGAPGTLLDECHFRNEEGSAKSTREPRQRFLTDYPLEGLGSVLCAPIPYSLSSNGLIRTYDAINGMTLK